MFLFVIRIMLNMRKTNRLINDFKKQTKNSICKFMNVMATANYSVYSTHQRGLYPHLQDQEIYIYADDATVVLLCLDCCGNDEEHTYEESEEVGPVIYSEGKEPRASMVWKMKEALKQAKDCLQSDIAVYGVIMTEANISNADEMATLWDSLNIKVIDGFRSLKHRDIKVNCDSDLNCKAYVDAILDLGIDSEFEKMLTEYINREYDKEFGGGTADDEPDNDNDDNDYLTDEDNEDDDNLSEDVDEDEDDVNSIILPDGTIEQNNNVSVQVDILPPIANPREELDKMVGCDNIKRHIEKLVNLTTYNKTMSRLFPDCKQHAVSLHSVFFGRPGTGKTTICKIFGSLLRQAGALTIGHVVMCDRSTFLGTLWGDEERSIRQVLEKAQGGVLMIDEAYLLNSGHPHDPGRIVIQQLMNILSNETQRNIAIVMCGYKEPMMKLLDVNPGLASRFPNRFDFHDFTVEDLEEISRRRVQDYEYQFTDEAWAKYCRLLSDAYKERDPQTWGNARFVANLLEHIYIQHAERCVREQYEDKLSWRLLTPEDIVPIEVSRQKKRIGF